MKAKLIALALVLAGCSNANEPSINGGGGDDRGGVPAVVGAWCGSADVSTVTRSADGSAMVRAYLNTTKHTVVADRDGILRTQEVRGCATGFCRYGNVSGFTDGELIARCREALT